MNGDTGFDLAGSGAEPLQDDDPRQIGSIPLVGRLGAGGMGRVYLGVHEGRYAAVKQVLPSVAGEDEDFLRRFGHELDNLARLPADATAPLLAGDRDARPPWFATAYVPGITLREAVELHGPLPARALWLLLREAAAGLAAVHELDMVHRDLKPSNVMLTLDGLTLIDFGVARAAEQSQVTRTGMVVGTPAFMSPEQASGVRASSGAVDVFALGSVLAYAASGRPPFGEDSGHPVLYRIVHEQPDLEPLRELDPQLADVVASCLDKDYEGRPSAAELVELAEQHGPFTPPLWPDDITAPLTERAAFAERIPEPDRLPAPASAPAPVPEPTSASTPDPAPPKKWNRRTKVVLAVVPVVVVAATTTLAIRLLPYSTPAGDEARGGAATATASAGSSPGANPSGSPAHGSSASAGGEKAKGGEDGRDGDDGKGGENGEEGRNGQNGADGKGTGAGSGGSDGGGSGDGSGGTEGGAGSGGSTASGGSGGGSDGTGGSGTTGTSGGTGPDSPASGTAQYRNGDTGECLSALYGAAQHGSCSGAAASWTVRSASDGSFQLVNNSSKQCMYANMLGQAVFVGSCGKASSYWRSASGGALKSVSNGGCLDLGMNSGVITATCAGEASQRWTRS
ncbi:serine/threonine protein kinase [Streptomyces sp. 15-116A]|uniref:serine/threonine-protein kinase n=1 Tax=Streptomyces sp. 15-116A TaxID=2259035 RepID=UPI0021B3D999|nr:serine/threonine protein kinase [Streptomyces sp. 15-116A]MCT7350811.1 serine/threonine protein kinase [Streptomyces sp. 15-116A]